MKVLTTKINIAEDSLALSNLDLEAELKRRLKYDLAHNLLNAMSAKRPMLIVLSGVIKHKQDREYFQTWTQHLYVMNMEEHRSAITSLHIPDDWIEQPIVTGAPADSLMIRNSRISFPRIKSIVQELKKIFSV